MCNFIIHTSDSSKTRRVETSVYVFREYHEFNIITIKSLLKIQVQRNLIIDILDPFGVSIFSVILSPPAGLSTAGWFASRS